VNSKDFDGLSIIKDCLNRLDYTFIEEGNGRIVINDWTVVDFTPYGVAVGTKAHKNREVQFVVDYLSVQAVKSVRCLYDEVFARNNGSRGAWYAAPFESTGHVTVQSDLKIRGKGDDCDELRRKLNAIQSLMNYRDHDTKLILDPPLDRTLGDD
jgi:hypothetical protein